MSAACSLSISLLLCIAVAGCTVNPPEPHASHAMSDVSRLEDARFAPAIARAGVWMPWKFHRTAGAGIYFLENYDDSKVPVLFIHGMYGSPRDFRFLISRLDLSAFQPWFYYYASGDDLSGTSEYLWQELDSLCAHYNVRSVVIVAHSMGGLIARDVLLRTSGYCRMAVPVLITLSTPWDGHRAAALGARFWPNAVRSWHDLATGSAYIEALFATTSGLQRHLPASTEHYLFASLGRHKRSANVDDEVVSVASQLRNAAQMDSYRIYRFEETHIGILNSAAVADSLNRTLATVLTHQR